MVLVIETLIFAGTIFTGITLHRIFKGCKTETPERIFVQTPNSPRVRRRKKKRDKNSEPLITKIQRGSESIYEDSSESREECTICLEYFKNGDDIRKLKCNHIFHENCIEEWFLKEITCPVCRDEN